MDLNRHALKALRERSGLTATELASKAHTSQSHLSNIESGARLASPKVTRRLAAALGVDLLAITHRAPVGAK